MPFLEALATPWHEPLRIEPELAVEPGITRDEPALRMLSLRCLLDRGEETCERGFDLGLRVGLTIRRIEKLGAVDQAVHARSEEVRRVMQQLMPLDAVAKSKHAGPSDEIFKILVATLGSERPEHCRQSERKNACARPRF
jgi:hypothetical protein